MIVYSLIRHFENGQHFIGLISRNTANGNSVDTTLVKVYNFRKEFKKLKEMVDREHIRLDKIFVKFVTS
jgi:hypothetical protein